MDTSIPASLAGSRGVDDRLGLVLGEVARALVEGHRDVADRLVLAERRARPALSSGLTTRITWSAFFSASTVVVDGLLVLRVGELAARHLEHHRVGAVGLLREVAGQQVLRALRVGARQRQVVAVLLAGGGGHERRARAPRGSTRRPPASDDDYRPGRSDTAGQSCEALDPRDRPRRAQAAPPSAHAEWSEHALARAQARRRPGESRGRPEHQRGRGPVRMAGRGAPGGLHARRAARRGATRAPSGSTG